MDFANNSLVSVAARVTADRNIVTSPLMGWINN